MPSISRSGLQVQIVSTLISKGGRLDKCLLAKLTARSTPVVDEALEKLMTEGVLSIQGDDVVLNPEA